MNSINHAILHIFKLWMDVFGLSKKSPTYIQNPYREDKAKMVALKLQALNCNSHNFAKKRS